MKNLFIILFAFIAFVACNNKADESETTEETASSEMEMTEETTETNQKKTDEPQVISDEDLETFKEVSANVADQVINAYLEIKDALVDTNGEVAKMAAESVHENLKNHEGDAISKIREDISHIASTQSVEHQREHFKSLSAHVYALAKSSDANNMTLYKQYCPMAFDNTGAYWLSSSDEVLNPYFGDKMLKCGKVQETLSK